MESPDDREEEQVQRNGGDGHGRRSPDLDLNLAIPKEDDADQDGSSSPLRERQCVQESEQEDQRPPQQQVLEFSERSPSSRRSASPVAKSSPLPSPRRSLSPECLGRKSLSPVSPHRKQEENFDEQEPFLRERSLGKSVSLSPQRVRSVSPRRRHLSPEIGRRLRERDLSGSPRDSGRRHRERFLSRSPAGRSARSGRSRSRSPARDYRRSPRSRYSPRPRYSPTRRSSPTHHSRQRNSRSGGRPWSPPTNRNTGVGKPGKNLFVAGFSFVTTERDLEKKFSRYGHVTDVRIIRDRRSGDSRGFGFLSLEHDEDADAAIRGLDQTEWNGRIVLVEKAKTLSRY